MTYSHKKRLNKTLNFLIAFLAITTISFSQVQGQGFYLRAGGGYSLQSAKTEFNNADPNELTGIKQSTEVTVSADGSTTNVKSLNGSLGAGFKGNITGGYMFNPYIGAELGINYFHGDETVIGKLSSPVMNSEEVAYIRGVDLSPAIIVTPGFEGINPYARVGLLITAAGDLTIETSADIINGGGAGTDIALRAESEVTAKFSIGYVAAVGILLPVNDRISLFGEAEFKSFTIKSDEAEIKSFTTSAISDGQSVLVPGQQLEDMPVSEKKFIFKDDYTFSNTTPQPEDQPTTIPSQEVNASGAGINIGIRISF
ncbi:outer membrane beta-barrel protein [Fulvivirga sp. 29W222]|uniref:Outer membrane beta-barrel protein n=1 Tax=Fulvivirga marina TaxID=2494733 RepID=A0A937G4R2_9BACT|nr:outer membrane beta-barrel protein [Fulvivirga marina]MBL6448406.1 outer membrane beta-barrel protein [Fulvivirga marina]